MDQKKKRYNCPQCGIEIETHAHKPERPCQRCREVNNGVPVVSHDEWWKRYRKWVEEALEETNDGSGGILDETPVEELEVCDNGQVHVKGSLILTSKGTVTPWEESRHYCHTRK